MKKEKKANNLIIFERDQKFKFVDLIIHIIDRFK